MKQIIEKLSNKVLKKIGLAVMDRAYLQQLRETNRAAEDLVFLEQMPEAHMPQLLRLLKKSKAQLRQDLFALSESNFKQSGYFVEFGATNGVTLSNTHLLEKEFGWTGILAEPARCWHNALRRTRCCNIETSCVWSDTGAVLSFNEASIAELSGAAITNNTDLATQNVQTVTYDVTTISLLDLLKKHCAPREIDMLSIDTEGSEFQILKAFDFNEYHFKTIVCEHNFTENREKIQSLLIANGYIRKHESFSQFDDWYVSKQ